MDEVVAMSRREMDRAQVVGKVVEGRLTQANAAKMLKLSVRQVKRQCAKFRDMGPPGLAHGLRGQPSNHQIDPWRLETALNALHDPLWEGFGPTFTHDKLKELCGVEVSVETLRQLMILTGIWRPWGQRLKHRSWRERRECVGMLVQLDGSDHDWFEGRGPRCVLIIYIDDATSRILYGEFVGVEDTMTLLHTTRGYLKAHGRPTAFYVDHDSIYVNNAPGDEQPMTQFARAMDELGVDIIPADSPQAKGRVERGFHTHQDRLVKELRLRGISTPEAANRYLQGNYIPKHNARYAIAPRSTLDVHKPLIAGVDLLDVLSVKLTRVVRNDYTIQYFKRWIQIPEGAGVRPKAEVTVQTRLDGEVRLLYKGLRLDYMPLPGKPERDGYSDSNHVKIVHRYWTAFKSNGPRAGSHSHSWNR